MKKNKSENLNRSDLQIGISTIVLAFSLSLALSLGLTLLVQSTYDLPLRFVMLLTILPLYVAGAVYVNSRKSKIYPLVMFGVNALICVGILLMNLGGAKDAMWNILRMLKVYTFRDLPLPAAKMQVSASDHSITLFFLLLATWPASLTSFVVLRRRSCWFALTSCLPYILCTIALDYLFPSMLSCEMVIASIILLVCLRCLRKEKGERKDQIVLRLAFPVVALLLVLGIIFPQKGYNKNEWAEKEKAFFKSIATDVSKLSNKMPKSVLDFFKQKEKAEQWSGSSVITDIAKQVVVMNDGSKEDLSMVGDFEPPEVEIMTVERYPNATYAMDVDDSRYIYLKTASMGKYSDNVWMADEVDMSPQDFYLNGVLPDPLEGKYILEVTMEAKAVRRAVPYYADNYRHSSETGAGEIHERTTDMLQELSPELDGSTKYVYAYNNVPVKVAGAWSDEYLDLVYSRYLNVPSDTWTAIETSDVLPVWFKQCMSDPGYLSDEEKVKRVIAMVSQLHPYDASTPYPPDDKDFIEWFIEDADTGFCVHYATTAAILLRMIGVPTRYVNGYMLNNVRNWDSCPVFTTDAHAWFEFFTEDYGWVLCDPTPGNQNAMEGFGLNTVKTDSQLAVDLDQNHPPRSRASEKIQELITPRPTLESEDVTTESSQSFASLHESVRQMEEERQSFVGRTKIPFWAKLILVILAIVVVLLIIRLGYCLWWKNKFSSGNVNNRARAYYRYIRLALIPYKKRPSRKLVSIAQKAAFSADGVTNEELQSLIDLGQKMLTTENAKNSRIRRFVSKHLIQVGTIR